MSLGAVLCMVRGRPAVCGAGLMKMGELGQNLVSIEKFPQLDGAYTDEATPADQKEMLYTIALASQLAEYSGRSYYTKGLYLPGIQECYQHLELTTEAKDQLRDKMATLSADG